MSVLPRQNHEVGHQFVVFRPHRRGCRRAGQHRQIAFVALRLRPLDASLDVAHRLQVLVDLAAVRSTELAAQPCDVLVTASRMLRSSCRSA